MKLKINCKLIGHFGEGYKLNEFAFCNLSVHLNLKFRILQSPGPEVIKLFSCSTQLSMKFSPLINVKMPTIVGILTFWSRKNSIIGLSEPKQS